MKFTRRDLLIWGAGAAAGLVVTPVPWKLLDDTSIWSQNWPWIPQPDRGPVEVKTSACTLCPNGCAVRVRMAGGFPVGVSGEPKHPVTQGTVCPLAFGAHQLNWHPQRLRAVKHRSVGSSWDEARTAFAKASSEGPVVVIDGFPGRASSAVLEAFAKQHGGEYRVVRSAVTRSLSPYAEWSGVPAESLGYDIANAQTVISFGAPLLDGWSAPGWFTKLWSNRAAGMTDPQLRIIQVESDLSRTANSAWKWIPIRSGSESAFAAGLARVLLEEQLVSRTGPLPKLSLADVAEQSAVSVDEIRHLALVLTERTPVVAIAKEENYAVAALNLLLGSVGTPGGIVRRSERSDKFVSADGPISGARAVLIDASVPWDLAIPVDAEVFRFAGWDTGNSHADWLLPAPGFLEEATDLPTAPGVPVETYAAAPALVNSAHEVHSAAQFVDNIDPALPIPGKLIHERCEALFRSRSGWLYGQTKGPVTQCPSAKALEDQLWAGSVWMAEGPRGGKLGCGLKEWPLSEEGPEREPISGLWSAAISPPLATKLYQESGLRQSSERRAI